MSYYSSSTPRKNTSRYSVPTSYNDSSSSSRSGSNLRGAYYPGYSSSAYNYDWSTNAGSVGIGTVGSSSSTSNPYSSSKPSASILNVYSSFPHSHTHNFRNSSASTSSSSPSKSYFPSTNSTSHSHSGSSIGSSVGGYLFGHYSTGSTSAALSNSATSKYYTPYGTQRSFVSRPISYEGSSRRRAPSPEFLQRHARSRALVQSTPLAPLAHTTSSASNNNTETGGNRANARSQDLPVATSASSSSPTTRDPNPKNNSSKFGFPSTQNRDSISSVRDTSVPNTTSNIYAYSGTNNSCNSSGSQNRVSVSSASPDKKSQLSLKKRLSSSLSSLIVSLGSLSNTSKPSSVDFYASDYEDPCDYDDYSDSVGSGKGSGFSSDVEQDGESSKNENGVSTRINYKKLYEEVLKENQTVKSRLSRAEEELSDLKLKLEKIAMSQRIGADDVEKREKKALERKLSEMEEELKQMQKLKLESEKLKAENRALTRVVSKLSGGGSSGNNSGTLPNRVP